MKITIENPAPGEEEEIIVRCRKMNTQLMNLLSALNEEPVGLTGYRNDKIVKLSLTHIYYIEAAENWVNVYTQQEMYEVPKTISEIERICNDMDLLRVSETVIVNLAKIAYIRPISNGRFEAKLKNHMKIIIARKYVNDLKKWLDI